MKRDPSLTELKKELKSRNGYIFISSDMELRQNGKIYELTSGGRWRGYSIDRFFKYRINADKARKICRALKSEDDMNWANASPRDMLTRSNNAFVRWRWIEHYGPERFIQDLGGKIVDVDGTSQLHVITLKRGEEPLVYVQVQDSTTGRTYYMRVPPHIRTCRKAIAWTFGLESEEYVPLKET